MSASLLLATLPLLMIIFSAETLAQEERRSESIAQSIDPLDHGPEMFDVLHYDAELHMLEAPTPTLNAGICRTTLRWTLSGDGVYRFNLRDLTIDSVIYNDALYQHKSMNVTTLGDPSDALYYHTAALRGDVTAGDTGVVTIYYHGTMTDEYGPGTWGGVSSSQNVLYSMGVGFNNNYVSTTQHWLPCFDHPYDKATFSGLFVVKSGMTVASNGLLKETMTYGDGTTGYRWEEEYPAATYLLTFAIAPYTLLSFGSGTLPIEVYALPADTTQTRKTFSLLPAMVSTFEERFTPYPFEKVGYVNTPQGAMEHQTMISFPTSLSRQGNSLNTTGAHELAHQWFGDLVSPVDFRHAWLNESFATFCESLWLEDQQGSAGYLAAQSGAISTYFNSIVPAEGALPLYDFSRTSPSSNYPPTIYYKGAAVVGLLRYELGDSLFFQGLRTYLQRYAYGTASTDDLQEVLEEVSGRDLGTFFDEWIRRAGWPELLIEADLKSVTNQATLRISQVQPAEFGLYSDLPLEIGIVTLNGIENHVIRLTQQKQEFTLASSAKPLQVQVNNGPTVRIPVKFTFITSSVEEAEEVGSVRIAKIQPNLITGDEVVRILPTGKEGKYVGWITVYDSTGQILVSQQYGSPPLTLDVRDLESGIYIVRIQSADVDQADRIIIKR